MFAAMRTSMSGGTLTPRAFSAARGSASARAANVGVVVVLGGEVGDLLQNQSLPEVSMPVVSADLL